MLSIISKFEKNFKYLRTIVVFNTSKSFVKNYVESKKINVIQNNSNIDSYLNFRQSTQHYRNNIYDFVTIILILM